jgi:hypothetical protein
MLEVASALILYVCSLPCLYGILRLAVRHGIRDADQVRQEAAWQAREDAARRAREQAELQARTFVPENAYLAGS